jgi:hypothetical protein
MGELKMGPARGDHGEGSRPAGEDHRRAGDPQGAVGLQPPAAPPLGRGGQQGGQNRVEGGGIRPLE